MQKSGKRARIGGAKLRNEFVEDCEISLPPKSINTGPIQRRDRLGRLLYRRYRLGPCPVCRVQFAMNRLEGVLGGSAVLNDYGMEEVVSRGWSSLGGVKLQKTEKLHILRILR